MNIELIEFNATDGVSTYGFVSYNNSNKVIISTHGMTSNCFKNRDKIILHKAYENGIDFLGYNNRGSELAKYIKKVENDNILEYIAGMSYENPKESYYDIKGAILKAIELGYKDIFLQGHSLGSTKVVYVYNRLKEEKFEYLSYIKGIILLSLIDIPRVLKVYLNKNYDKFLKLAEEKEKNNELLDLMPNESFIHPISVKTFLIYSKYNSEIDFAQYSNNNFSFDVLNNIKVPLFMRWGNVYEMIEQQAEDLAKIMNRKIINNKKDISFIDGANHGYYGKEDLLAEQIINFIKNI